MKGIRFREFLASLAAIACMMVMLSCTTDAAPERPGPLSYRMRTYERYSTMTKETWWKCSYPVFEGSPAAARINEILLDAVAGVEATKQKGIPTSLPAAANAFIEDFEKTRMEFPDTFPYQSETTGSVLLNRDGRLTVAITYDAYTGGAHGMNSTVYHVFDTKSGKRLSLDDMFVPGYAKRLDALIDRRFRQMKGLSATDRLDSEQGTLFENFIRHNENFAVTDHGISFLYNPYEIAAYAYGPTEIDLKWQDLKGIVKP